MVKMSNLICNMYQCIKSRIIFNCEISDYFNCINGKAILHINRRQFFVLYTTAIVLILYLYAPTTLEECHAWFHLYDICRAARNRKQSKIQNENMSPSGIEPATPHFPTRHQDCSATNWQSVSCVYNLLHNHGIWIKSTCGNKCTKWIMVRFVLELSDKICISFTNVDPREDPGLNRANVLRILIVS